MQRAAFRSELKKHGIKNVQVSTVHQAQGGEKKIIFFDPVLGSHKAVTDRLINVALSRAKCRLIVALSQGDLANPRLAQLKTLLCLDISDSEALDLLPLSRMPDFPKKYIGSKVKHAHGLYILDGVDASGASILLTECVSGCAKKFKIAALSKLAAAAQVGQ